MAGAPLRHARPLFPSPAVALAVAVAGVLLEVAMLVPPVAEGLEDRLALHYAQHGAIFLAALLVGAGLRDLTARPR